MTMDSALMKFLREDYPKHLGIEDREDVKIQRRVFGKGEIPLLDENNKKDEKKEWVASVINNNTAAPLEVIEFESYIDQFKLERMKCDFVIGPVMGYSFILFNELTKSQLKYIKPYVQQKTGLRKEGKWKRAKNQLKTSIERFYEVGDLLDKYTKKIALFSYRLSDDDHNDEDDGGKQMKQYPPSIELDTFKEPLPHGFIFEQRLYPTPYVIE